MTVPTEVRNPAAAPPAASYRTNLVTALLSMWFTIGLFTDAWAHNTRPKLETFFTPWHALFYSGFTATAAWIIWVSRSRNDIPRGYRPALIAVGGFAVFGISDALWHTIFGIEQSLDILFSPTHLGLISTMLVIVTSPLRAAWSDGSLPHAPGLRRLFPAMLSLVLATTLVLLFLQYANAVAFRPAEVLAAMSRVNQIQTARFAAALLVTTIILMVPLLSVMRRWVLPFGTATMLFAFVCLLSYAVTGFRNTPLILAVLISGICADVLAWWLRPAPANPVRYRLFAALVPLVTWTLYLTTAHAVARAPRILDANGLPIPIPHPEGVFELYTGAPVVQALVGLLLAILLVPEARALVAPPGGSIPAQVGGDVPAGTHS
jgi:hypothetical protein